MDYLFHCPFIESGNKGLAKIDVLLAIFRGEKGGNTSERGREGGGSTAPRAIRSFELFYFTPAVSANKTKVGPLKMTPTYATDKWQEKAYQPLS